MAMVDGHKSTQTKTSKVTLAAFAEALDARLQEYMLGVNDILTRQMDDGYAEYQKHPERFGYKAGMSVDEFKSQYLHSRMLLQQNEEWCRRQSGAMSVTGLPGTAKTSIVLKKCAEYGLPCVHFTVAGLMGADIKGLPFVVRNENNVVTGVEYEQGTRLPISALGADLGGMSWEVFEAKYSLGVPAFARYLKEDAFKYDGGIAPEFGVLLLDEFTTLDDHAMATLEKILSEPVRGIRGLAEGSYVFPPYWIIICAMNLSNEGGLGSGDEEGESDMPPFIRERAGMHGFYTVFADASSREHLEGLENTDPVITGFLAWSDKTRKKDDGRAQLIEGEDAGFVQYVNPGGGLTSPRTWEKVLDRIAEKRELKAASAFDKRMSEKEKEAYQKEVSEGRNISTKAAGGILAIYKNKSDSVRDDSEVQEVMERVDRACAIAAKRHEELKKHNADITEAEYVSIMDALIGIPVVTNEFKIYYKVHSGIYGRFAEIEEPLKKYLLGVEKKGPKLKSLGDDVAKNAVAIGMSIKSYLKDTCYQVFKELYGRMRELTSVPVKSEDTLNELAQIAVNLYQLPLRVGRWLNTPDLFPVGIKDEVAAVCLAAFDFYFTIDGVEVPKLTEKGGGRYVPFARKAILAACGPRKSDLLALSKKSACALGANNALVGPEGATVPLAFTKATKETNWQPVLLKDKKVLTLPSGIRFNFEVADEADLEFIDIVTSKGKVGGNAVSELFTN